MGDRQAKNALFDGFANVAKALGNGRRVELIDVLAQGERHVDGLANEIGQSVANTSHHLHVLAAAGLVICVKNVSTLSLCTVTRGPNDAALNAKSAPLTGSPSTSVTP